MRNVLAGPRAAPYWFLAPFALGFALFTAYPLARSLVLAFQQTFGPGHVRFVGGDNFRNLLSDPLFWTAARNTVLFTLGAVLIQLPLALLLALALNRADIRGRAVWRLVFFSPSLVGVVFVAMIFALIFEKQTGLVNVALHRFTGGSWSLDFPWLQRHVVWSLIIATLWQYLGFSMVYFLAALQNVRADVREAAVIDGAGSLGRFRHVTLPAIRPVAGFVVLLSIVGSFQVFELPYIMLNSTGGPDNRGLTLVMYLYQSGFEVGDLGYASAIGWVLAATLIGATAVQRRLGRAEEEAPA